MATSRKILACVTHRYHGQIWHWTLWGDGRVTTTRDTRWVGCSDGRRWSTTPGYVDVTAPPQEANYKQALRNVIASCSIDGNGQIHDLDHNPAWTVIKTGRTVA